MSFPPNFCIHLQGGRYGLQSGVPVYASVQSPDSLDLRQISPAGSIIGFGHSSEVWPRSPARFRRTPLRVPDDAAFTENYRTIS